MLVPRILRGVALLILTISLAIYLTQRKEGPHLAFEPKRGTTMSGRLEKGQTLSRLLSKEGVESDLSSVIIEKLGKIYNLRSCHPGDSFYLAVSDSGDLKYFEYVVDPTKIYVLERGEEGIEAYKKEIKVDTVPASLQGAVASSLCEAVVSLDERAELAFDFADIFSWQIDFNTEVRSGDRFKLLFAKRWVDTVFVGYGRILAAEYEGWRGSFKAFFYRDPDGHSDYYDFEGKCLRKMFLRAPLTYRRISSYFSLRRLHPILRVYRPHRGIDYAAPLGTPVSTVADGVVIFCGWKGGYGKLVRIRHPNSYMTEYGHLSGFARGMKKGKRVKQGQVIGYVGSTGLSTGPHLQYGMKRGGKWVNPLKVNPPAASPVKKKYRADYRKRRDELSLMLEETLSRL